jgi:hypothetical protein
MWLWESRRKECAFEIKTDADQKAVWEQPIEKVKEIEKSIRVSQTNDFRGVDSLTLYGKREQRREKEKGEAVVGSVWRGQAL